MEFNKYNTWIFDCDGVILDSNNIKTNAFFDVVLPYGKDYADTFIEYHKKNGGISRYQKFKYFFDEIVRKHDYQKDLNAILEAYRISVQRKLILSDETEGLRDFISVLPRTARKIVVSGGDQEELREVFQRKRLDRLFDEIFGSPRDKRDIIREAIQQDKILEPVVFIGDSQFDYEVSKEFDYDFIFMSKYSEFHQWRSYFSNNQDIFPINSLKDLLPMFNTTPQCSDCPKKN